MRGFPQKHAETSRSRGEFEVRWGIIKVLALVSRN